MKIEKHIIEKEKEEVVAQVPVKSENLLASLKQHKGHTLFEFNTITGEITEAVFESVDASFPLSDKTGTAVRKKVLKKTGCVYISALNRKNAKWKFYKMATKQTKN